MKDGAITQKGEAMSDLKPCPLCGGKAFISHDIIDGYDFGWSVGCSRACINDCIHKLNEDEFIKARITIHCLASKEEAIKTWNRRVDDE